MVKGFDVAFEVESLVLSGGKHDFWISLGRLCESEFPALERSHHQLLEEIGAGTQHLNPLLSSSGNLSTRANLGVHYGLLRNTMHCSTLFQKIEY